MRARKLIWAGLALLTSATSALGQTPPPQPRKVYTSKQLFVVPLKIENADRVSLRALKFYAKPLDKPWGLVETGTPQTTRFTYQALSDGEYWFNFGTVNDAGKEMPEQPDREPPRLIVVVDTQAPELAAVPLSVASGQTFIQGIIRDANPDPTTLTMEYEALPNDWRPLTLLDRDAPGIFRAPEGGWPVKVRVAGKDKAGNAATQVVSVNVHGSEIVPQSASPAAPAPVVAAPVSPIAAPGPVVAAPAPLPIQPAPTPELIVPTPPRPVAPEVVAAPAPGPVVMPPRVAEKPPVADTPVPAGTRQIINTRRCELSYALDGLGSAPPARVEAYGTRDEGKTWIRLGEDPDRKSPIELTLPDEGAYGIVLVVSTAGQPGPPPALGDTPDWWVEVDTKAPEVRLESAALGTGDEAGVLNLRWSVRDQNLRPDAVEVAWSHLPDGPWQPIATGLRADGQYRWPVPREAGSRVFLRIEAADRAANVGRFITPQPVTVEAVKPRARVLGINPAAVKP